MVNKILGVGFFAFAVLNVSSQEAVGPMKPSAYEAGINHWHMQDMQKDGTPGVSAEKAYTELLVGRKSTPVVVAIIDSGTETFHPDLKDNVWINPKEIAGNNVDDDKNGYVDDIHGWSFIGGEKGDVSFDNLEFTRIYRDLKNRFGTVTDEKQVSDSDRSDYARFIKMKGEYDKRWKTAQEEAQNFEMVVMFYERSDEALRQVLGKEDYTVEDVQAMEPKDDFMKAVKEFMTMAMQEDLKNQFAEGKEHYDSMLQYQLNLDFDPRYLVGDNYSDSHQKNYGNNHVDGPESDHGTHVGGIVGATRNGFGMDGIADNVRLMIVRCVPNGDERDKDVANSIRYAVDNGARVINMSFGKSYSPQKDVVDEAVKYAESKGVLLVHAAGNDGKNVDVAANFPKDKYNSGEYCSTWLEIGASGRELSALSADFSNYGKKSVDVFAPGVDIYSTVTGDQYKDNSGTSMASPVTAGVAATILSYYPQLTAKDVKAIIMKSAVNYGKQKVVMPGNPSKKVKFKKLSVTGGVVNLYEALKLAETWKSGSQG